MQKQVKFILITLCSTLLLLLAIEAFSAAFLRWVRGDVTHLGFMVNTKRLSTMGYDMIERLGYKQVDPLLGYSKTNKQLQSKGFTISKGCVVFRTADDTANGINIFISGGSTSDVAYCAQSWPLHFCKLLRAHGIKATVYVGAVGGYDSGQELLKLIRDGLELNPDIHISYSGANDLVNPNYITIYEDAFFTHKVDNSFSSFLMPQTIYLIKGFLARQNSDMEYLQRGNNNPAVFWEKNMRIMHGIARENGYLFAGFLQPMPGSGKYKQEVIRGDEADTQKKKEAYPTLQLAAARNSEFITDLSATFDTCKGIVYSDNCHIYDQYEPLIAENIFSVLVQKNMLPGNSRTGLAH